MIDSSLASQVRAFQQLMEKEKDLYSVKDLLSIYHRYLPVNMMDETLRKNVHCYLMVSELETELNQTWFYAMFPGLRYTANGVTLSSICGILRAKLHSLEDLAVPIHQSRTCVRKLLLHQPDEDESDGRDHGSSQ